MIEDILKYRLIKTNRRLTFDIEWQSDHFRYFGTDDGTYSRFTASNNWEVISRSRMDIQYERIWLHGGVTDEHYRSGSMVFPNNEKRDEAYNAAQKALQEWYEYVINEGGF